MSLRRYKIKFNETEFINILSKSGLLNKNFTLIDFKESYQIKENQLFLLNKKADERLAQIIADFLRKKLLKEKKKFSFETVFSHSSKLEIMQAAIQSGYKVYLYFLWNRWTERFKHL